jgi:1-acyl-sn-glycerol-3-phosphate acyltransferase
MTTRPGGQQATECALPACTSDCAGTPGATVGAGRRWLRTAAVLVAIGYSALCIAVAAALPSHRKLHRLSAVHRRAARRVLRALGVRVHTTGKLRSGPSLVVGNHQSFLDILILAADAPMRMVAKSEVSAWPVVGWIADRTGTLFLERDSWSKLPDAVAEMTAALRSGHRVQVFPEGTTRCGSAVGVFRRAAFQAAIDAAVVVSPVTVRYTDAAGPTAAAAFVGDETLFDCLRRVIASRGLVAEVRHLPAVPAIAGTGRRAVDRRTVTSLVESAVARDLGVPVIRPTQPVARPVPTVLPEQTRRRVRPGAAVTTQFR